MCHNPAAQLKPKLCDLDRDPNSCPPSGTLSRAAYSLEHTLKSTCFPAEPQLSRALNTSLRLPAHSYQ